MIFHREIVKMLQSTMKQNHRNSQSTSAALSCFSSKRTGLKAGYLHGRTDRGPNTEMGVTGGKRNKAGSPPTYISGKIPDLKKGLHIPKLVLREQNLTQL